DLGVVITENLPADAEILVMGDIDIVSLQKALEYFEVEMPQEYAVAVQDHGESVDISNRLFRFKHWEKFISEGGDISQLVYYRVPPYLTRMKSVQQIVPGTLVMDTCSAALWGALEDEQIAKHREKGLTLINIGNQHTFAVLLKSTKVYGIFEHHTGILTPAELSRYVDKFKAGFLTHDEIYNSGGHGCYIKEDLREDFDFTAVTGPQRHLACDLGYYPAAPHGDMMLTGCFGLVSAALSINK
ncbi:MAG: pyruvate formate lyase-activating protein, partial [Firmicutes bacterium HGW-Firmicutes-13]